MMFTPKGLSVSSRHFLISSLTASVPALIEEMRPRPPAFDTAAASDASATHAIPPWNTGYFIPSISHTLLFIMIFTFYPLPFKYYRTGNKSGTECAHGYLVALSEHSLPVAFVNQDRA